MNSEKFGNIPYADIHMWKYSYGCVSLRRSL